MKKGFTLLELLAVIVILAIIGVITTVLVFDIVNEAREKAYQNQIKIIENASQIYIGDKLLNSQEISEYIFIEDLISEGYLKSNQIQLNGAVRIYFGEDSYEYEFVESSSNFGEIVHIDPNRTLIDVIIEGNTEQKTSATQKNLIDPDKIVTGYNSNGGNVTSTQVITTSNLNVLTYIIKINANQTYYLSLDNPGSNGRYFFFDRYPMNDNTILSIGGAYVGSSTGYLITPVANTQWLFLVLTRDKINFPVGRVQLEQGNLKTKYEQFVSNKPTTAYFSALSNVEGNLFFDGDLAVGLPILRSANIEKDTYSISTGIVERKVGLATIPNNITWNDWNLTTKRVLHDPSSLRKIGHNSLGLSNFSFILNTSMGQLNSLGVFTSNGVSYWYPDWFEMGLSGEETHIVANQKLQEWVSLRNLEYTYVLRNNVNENRSPIEVPPNTKYIYTDSKTKPLIRLIYE